ncbi:hypothetical protein HDU84_009018 [Entophlyctis sp. JEL0112]|nr:hypothetical protein HDU84_009018 [Entophlyctis sp. JEL0112]
MEQFEAMEDSAPFQQQIVAASLRATELLSRARMNATFNSVEIYPPHTPPTAIELSANIEEHAREAAADNSLENQTSRFDRKSVSFSVSDWVQATEIQEDPSLTSMSQIIAPPSPHKYPNTAQLAPSQHPEDILTSAVSRFRVNLMDRLKQETLHHASQSAVTEQLGDSPQLIPLKINKRKLYKETATSPLEDTASRRKDDIQYASIGDRHSQNADVDSFQKENFENASTAPLNSIGSTRIDGEVKMSATQHNRLVQLDNELNSLEEFQQKIFRLNTMFLDRNKAFLGQQQDALHDQISKQFQSFQAVQEQYTSWQNEHLKKMRQSQSEDFEQQLIIQNKVKRLKSVQSMDIDTRIKHGQEEIDPTNTMSSLSTKSLSRLEHDAAELKEELVGVKKHIKELSSIAERVYVAPYQLNEGKEVKLDGSSDSIQKAIEPVVAQFANIQEEILKGRGQKFAGRHDFNKAEAVAEKTKTDRKMKGLIRINSTKNEFINDGRAYYRQLGNVISQVNAKKDGIVTELRKTSADETDGHSCWVPFRHFKSVDSNGSLEEDFMEDDEFQSSNLNELLSVQRIESVVQTQLSLIIHDTIVTQVQVENTVTSGNGMSNASQIKDVSESIESERVAKNSKGVLSKGLPSNPEIRQYIPSKLPGNEKRNWPKHTVPYQSAPLGTVIPAVRTKITTSPQKLRKKSVDKSDEVGDAIERYHISALSAKFIRSEKVIPINHQVCRSDERHVSKSHSPEKMAAITKAIHPQKCATDIPPFYNVKLSATPVFLRRTTLRPPTLKFLEGVKPHWNQEEKRISPRRMTKNS